MSWKVKIPPAQSHNQKKDLPIKLDIPELGVSDTITYLPEGRKGRKFSGVIIDQTNVLLVVNLGRYRDTILKNDLVSGRVKIISIQKGDGTVGGKIDKPKKEVLEALFKEASYVVNRAAKMNKPPVSDFIMANWLREDGIIPPIAEAPPADELRAAWEECNHKLSGLTRKYSVHSAVAKRWLKAAGIIIEGPTGISTVPKTPDGNSQEGQSPKDGEISEPKLQNNSKPHSPANDSAVKEPEPNTGIKTEDKHPEEDIWEKIYELAKDLRIVAEKVVTLEKMSVENLGDLKSSEADHETVKKMVDFCLAPQVGRIEKMEHSIGMMAQVMLDNGSTDQNDIGMLADLIVGVWRRLLNENIRRDKAVSRKKAV